MTGRRAENRLTRADTTALWHAVKAMADILEATRKLEGVYPEHLAEDEAQLARARRALRKANKLREEMGRRPGTRAERPQRTIGGPKP
ncbi:hypothetical protein ACUTR7_03810 [Delftia sp. NA_296.1]|uniref:hypothetical protein n=1 Tax=Delftia sp. NA_296.1 TaxID=3415648 RepID=UPI0040459E5D